MPNSSIRSRWTGTSSIWAKHWRKGSKVYIEGQLRTRKWQDASGNDRYSTEVVLQGPGSVLTMLDGAPGGGQGGGGGQRSGGDWGGGGNSGGSSGGSSGGGGGQRSGGSNVGGGGAGGGGFADDLDDDIPF